MANTYRNTIKRKKDELNRLRTQRARELKKTSSSKNKILSAQRVLQRTKSSSTIRMKYNQIIREEKRLADIDKKLADYDKKISKKEKEIFELEKKLNREIEREQKKRDVAEKKRIAQSEDNMEEVNRRLEELAKLPEKITVLFIASNPLNTQQLRLDEEAREIQEMIRKSDHRDSVLFKTRWATRALDVIQAINEENPTVIHFSGHGSEVEEIVFQDNQGNAKFVSKEAIVQTMMSASDTIKLVFFNTCFSSGQAQAVVEHVDAAIGMTESIGDEAARVFAAQFYSAVGFGLSLSKAFEQGKAALMLEGIPEEDIPELYLAENVNPDELVLVQP